MTQLQLAQNWKAILTQAWSVRFIIISGILSTAEVTLNTLVETYPGGSLAIAATITSTLALVARIIAQQGIEE